MKLFSTKDYELLHTYLTTLNISTELTELVKLNYVLDESCVDKYINGLCSVSEIPVDYKAVNELFKISEFDSMFFELFTVYPMKVRSSRTVNGWRILRPKSDDSLEGAKLKKKYKSIIKTDKAKHEHILKCLKAEVLHRSKDAFLMNSMQEMSTWLNNGTWQRYEHMVAPTVEEVIINKEEETYGEKLV